MTKVWFFSRRGIKYHKWITRDYFPTTRVQNISHKWLNQDMKNRPHRSHSTLGSITSTYLIRIQVMSPSCALWRFSLNIEFPRLASLVDWFSARSESWWISVFKRLSMIVISEFTIVIDSAWDLIQIKI